MPDATITSTASTFGTISGTFAADQSTISGTVYAITGTVNGSVGVPGPQGPSGSPGAQGPQGEPGEPGVGVPAGGLAGQVLAKVDGVSYNTQWVDQSGAVVWGDIGGDIDDQVDLYNALAAKYDASNPDGFITVADLAGYATESFVTSQGYITSAALAPYLTSVDAAATYQTKASMSAYLTKVGNLAGLTSLSTARDNLNLGVNNTPVFNGVTAQGSTGNVGNLTPTSLTLTQSGHGIFTIQPSQGIVFPDSTIQVTAYPGPVGATSWGSIVGTLSNQGDLSAALGAKLSTVDAASTYAITARGLPASGTVGQVLTKQSGTAYDSAWATIIPGDRYLTTSTTSLTIDNANKTLTVATGLSYSSQQDIVISYDATRHMHARVIDYNSATGQLDVDVLSHSGSGTFSLWTINVGGTPALQSVLWGEILGTLGNQGDLATALGNKLETSTAATTYLALAGGTMTGTLYAPTIRNLLNQNLVVDAYNDTGAGTHNYFNFNPYGGGFELPTNSSGIKFGDATVQTTAAVTFDPTGYATETFVTSQGYITSAALSGYATESYVNSQGFITSSALSLYAPLSGANFSGRVVMPHVAGGQPSFNIGFNSGASGLTSGDLWIDGELKYYLGISTETVATHNWVNGSFINASTVASDYLSKAGNLAGLASTSSSRTNLGLGSLAVVNDAPSDGSQYARKNGAWDVVSAGTSYISSVSSPLAVTSGNLTVNLSAYLTSATAAVTYYPLSGNPSSFLVAADIAGKANIASPSLTGVPLSTTAAANTNSTQIATTAFVVGQAGSATPLVNGTAAIGTSLRYARQDHVHGTDTSRLAAASNLSDLASASTARTNLGLGTAAVEPATKLVPAGGTIGQALVKLSNADHDDGWATVSMGGAVWGTISGVLASQLDLQAALDLKSPIASPTFTGTVTIPSGASIAGYLTTTAGNAAYYPLTGNPSGFLTSAPVTSVAGRTGAVVLAVADVSGAAPLASPTFTGTPTLPTGTIATTQIAGNSTTAVATTAFVTTADNLKANIASPTFTGTPLSTTAAVDTNTTQIATTAFVVAQAAAATPLVNGTAAVGTSLRYARADHVHATDTTRAPLASPAFTGTPSLPTGTTAITQTVGNNTTAVATTAFVTAAIPTNNVKAWVNFNGTGTVAIRGSLNVSSITDNGVGNYTVNFTTAMTDTNYALSGAATDDNAAATFVYEGGTYGQYRTASSARILSLGSGALRDPQGVYVAIFR